MDIKIIAAVAYGIPELLIERRLVVDTSRQPESETVVALGDISHRCPGADDTLVVKVPIGGSHTGIEIETAYGYSVFEYEIRPTLDLKQEIISRGNDMEVVYPESFRNEIKEMIGEMWNRYK